MQKHQTFIALYDVTPEETHFQNPILAGKARELGKALAQAGLGIIARINSPIVATTLQMLAERGGNAIALSPAVSETEHENAFRLPKLSMPLIFTGKGGLGADMIALHSAHAIVIVGSYPSRLENIIGYAKGRMVPLCVLTDEERSAIYERVRATDSTLAGQLIVSHDPAILARELAEELRRRHMNIKFG